MGKVSSSKLRVSLRSLSSILSVQKEFWWWPPSFDEFDLQDVHSTGSLHAPPPVIDPWNILSVGNIGLVWPYRALNSLCGSAPWEYLTNIAKKYRKERKGDKRENVSGWLYKSKPDFWIYAVRSRRSASEPVLNPRVDLAGWPVLLTVSQNLGLHGDITMWMSMAFCRSYLPLLQRRITKYASRYTWVHRALDVRVVPIITLRNKKLINLQHSHMLC